ncbi:MAG TPA: hypothetical protein DCE52_09105 [Rhodobacteraceae bacterium]|jgi:O-antigen ligase|nr:hypothetical protein [Paracoccaceae bacterium]
MNYIKAIFENNRIFLFSIFMLPVIASFSSRSTVPILFFLTLLSFFYSDKPLIRIPLNKGVLTIVVMSIGWLLFRAMYIESGEHSLLSWTKIVAICGAGLILFRYVIGLDDKNKARISRFLIGGVFVSLAIIFIGCLSIDAGYAEFLRTGRSDQKTIFSAGVIFVSLICPAVLYYSWINNKIIFSLLIITVSIVMTISQSFAAIFAVMAGVLSSIFILYFGFKAINVIKICLIFFTLSVPILGPGILTGVNEIVLGQQSEEADESVGIKGSVAHRYYIWKFTIDRAREHPILGWGLDASRSLPGGDVNIGIGRELMPLHPHNAFLQIWVELGYVGLMLLASIIWLMFPRTPPGEAFDKRMAILPITICMLVVIMSLSFGIWQSWWMSSIALIICLASMANGKAGQIPPSRTTRHQAREI